MFIELVCLTGGIIPGRLLRGSNRAMRITGKLTTCAIYSLLFIMGAGVGADNALFASLSSLGLQALVISLCCTLGSIICVIPCQRLFYDQITKQQQPKGNFSKGMLGSLYILGAFGLGLIFARFQLLPAVLHNSALLSYALWFMLFCVGMGIGFDLNSLLIVRNMGLRVVLIPLLGIAGTALGAVVAFIVLPGTELRETLAVGAGFGYYSISSIIISNQGYVALGSVALVANIIRELFTLLATPFLVRIFGPLAPVAAAGATGMDTCLPVVVRFTGEKIGIISIFNGLTLTMLVPFIVPLVMLLFS